MTDWHDLSRIDSWLHPNKIIGEFSLVTIENTVSVLPHTRMGTRLSNSILRPLSVVTPSSQIKLIRVVFYYIFKIIFEWQDVFKNNRKLGAGVTRLLDKLIKGQFTTNCRIFVEEQVTVYWECKIRLCNVKILIVLNRTKEARNSCSLMTCGKGKWMNPMY